MMKAVMLRMGDVVSRSNSLTRRNEAGNDAWCADRWPWQKLMAKPRNTTSAASSLEDLSSPLCFKDTTRHRSYSAICSGCWGRGGMGMWPGA